MDEIKSTIAVNEIIFILSDGNNILEFEDFDFDNFVTQAPMSHWLSWCLNTRVIGVKKCRFTFPDFPVPVSFTFLFLGKHTTVNSNIHTGRIIIQQQEVMCYKTIDRKKWQEKVEFWYFIEWIGRKEGRNLFTWTHFLHKISCELTKLFKQQEYYIFVWM